MDTCEPIYELNRRRKLENNRVVARLIVALSIFLTFCVVLLISFLQYDEYLNFLRDRGESFKKQKLVCEIVNLAIVEIVSTPLAFLLVLMYILLFKRRVFLKDKFSYRNIGLPMIVSCWNKSDRLYSSFTYGLIAFNVFTIAKTSINHSRNLRHLLGDFNDPSGIITLCLKLIQMFLIGIRYYPVLVGE